MNIKETIYGIVKSIFPLAIVIIMLQALFIGFSLESFFVFTVGVIVTIIGFSLFLIGAETSLLPIGEIIGVSLITKAKLWFILAFVVSLGFAFTVAEPGVQLLANQTEIVNKYLLIATVSLGVGVFLGLALLRFVFAIPLKVLLLGSYSLIFLIAAISPANFFPIAFDAGGVTTGPMAVPFILALGFGVTSIKGIEKQTHESFGFVALASIGPILAVLILGVIFG